MFSHSFFCNSLLLTVNHIMKIWGARLCGWNAPVSPLEVNSKLILELNHMLLVIETNRVFIHISNRHQERSAYACTSMGHIELIGLTVWVSVRLNYIYMHYLLNGAVQFQNIQCFLSSVVGKSACAPLAFKCIKGSGGVVPSTLVGVTRVYPVLYRERYEALI